MNDKTDKINAFFDREEMPDTLNGPEQPDLFVPIDKEQDWPVKENVASMEYPIFSLSKKPDINIRTYTRGDKTLRIIPSALGSATVFDKDLLIYCISQIAKAINAGEKASRRVKVETYPFLIGTKRSTGGAAYERIVDMCRRLKGTNIETNIKTNESERLHGFGLIEDYSITQRTKNEKGALELEVTISEWLYRAAIEFDILTLNADYFKLSQALERRIYEIGRKHCGDKAWWTCNLILLQEKTGSTRGEKYFRREIKDIIESNHLPDYKLALDTSVRPNQLVYISRDSRKVFMHAAKTNKLTWLTNILKVEKPKDL